MNLLFLTTLIYCNVWQGKLICCHLFVGVQQKGEMGRVTQCVIEEGIYSLYSVCYTQFIRSVYTQFAARSASESLPQESDSWSPSGKPTQPRRTSRNLEEAIDIYLVNVEQGRKQHNPYQVKHWQCVTSRRKVARPCWPLGDGQTGYGRTGYKVLLCNAPLL